ncbi:unnamed protein product [Parascedosporium putredinis]|uniref:AMP-dependent synthetase/ligase domain-containing protein n=1 Tax=Parascedosporium putredinis TaxID=1442378 RepID=A0A9P1H880_9PEZI|nr:unnamed protein product [Parascedosporium putredinis]CAI7999061.1 unnamed protein product [Parascedosporium putredinis]
MGSAGNFMVGMDEGVSGIFSQWNVYTTALAGLLAAGVTYRVATSVEPDTHPLRLARQALPNLVRQEGESALYRSSDLGGGELRTGLDVRRKGASKWSKGSDGDLRDVWRQVVQGAEEREGVKAGARGKLLTVHGSRNVTEHKIDEITRSINLIGQHISQQGGIRVAIYLPNSIELLVTLFACSFYPNLTTILIPFGASTDELITMLRRSAADTAYPSLRNLIWVLDAGSSHMDWNEVPEGMGGSVNVATWQEIIDDSPLQAGLELPEDTAEAGPVVVFWQGKPGTLEEMIKFTQKNVVAGVGAILSSLPTKERMGPEDVLLAADSLANMYSLVVTLAGLFSNATVAFNSVAGRSTDLVLATQGISPTILVAAPETLARVHEESTSKVSSALQSAALRSQLRTLSDKGAFPSPQSFWGSFLAPARPVLGAVAPSKLRVVFVAERVNGGAPALSSRQLAELRVFLGARVVYALTAGGVAGPVAQTWFHDYRILEEGPYSHFGPPSVAVEVFLRDNGEYKTTDDKTEGEIVARGPSVARGELPLGVNGRIRDDNTLAYV